MVVFGLITAVVCRPFGWAASAVHTQRDALFSAAAHHHLQRVLLGQGAWDTPPLAWPLDHAQAMTDWFGGSALLALPAMGLGPLQAYVWAGLLGLVLTSWACHLAAQALLGQGAHTVVAGLIGGLGPVQVAHLSHVNLVHHQPMVLGALFLGLGLVARRPLVALLGGAIAASAGHFGMYMGAHAALAAACILTGAALARQGDRGSWLAALGGLGLGGLALAPVAGMYLQTALDQDIGLGPAALMAESWDLAHSLAPHRAIYLHHWLGVDTAPPTLDPPNPGYMALSLGAIGLPLALARRPHRWAWGAILGATVLAALLALGPEPKWLGEGLGVPGPAALLSDLPGGLRAPARWLAVGGVGVGLFAAVAVQSLGRRGRWGLLGALVLVGLTATERLRPRPSTHEAIRLGEAYVPLLALEGTGPLLDKLGSGCRHTGEHRLAAALQHHRPLVGGRYARASDALQSLNHTAESWPSTAAQDLLDDAGVDLVFEHPPLSRDAPPGWDCVEAQRHRLCQR